MKLCKSTIDGPCLEPAVITGFCSPHYQRILYGRKIETHHPQIPLGKIRGLLPAPSPLRSLFLSMVKHELEREGALNIAAWIKEE